jgi:glycosyltransferase involved in cell wall biosynthesis
LPEILRQNPKAVVLIVGGDGVSYGAKPPGEKTWKEIFRAEVENQIADEDWARVHYLGNIAYSHFVTMLQISSAHIYLTYPFVLSWSLLEAMSVGCAIVASSTAPLREAIVDQQTGRLVDFFDHAELARAVLEVLANPSIREALGKNARAFACAHYDLQTVCLPRQLQWVEQWAA